VAGVASIGVGLFTVLFPPVGEPDVWGYPFDRATHVIVASALVVIHLLKAPGFVALSGLDGAEGLTRWSMRAAALGFIVLATCEGFSAVLVGVPTDSPAAINLDNGYAVGSMLSAMASVVGGTVIARKKLLEGRDRWSVLLSGVFMIVVVTPALMAGRGPLAYLALTGWSLFFIWIGRALGRADLG